ncbi:MAG: ABC transporter permease [Proteobacteria bacterium]|nr:ABC transporter permease [Pseudomonadota bacterium]
MNAMGIKARIYARQYWQFCKEKPLGAFGATVFFIMIALAIGANVWATADPLSTNIRYALNSPSKDFWFGTDYLGRDVWSRFVHGARSSVWVVVAGVLLSTISGGLLGIISGYKGGKIDHFLQRVMDFLMSIPVLLMGIIVMVMLGPALINVAIAIGIVYIPRINRLSRSSAIGIKSMPYIEAAKTMGHSHLFIIFKHVLPNSLAILLVYGTALLGGGFLVESGLSFLGVGIPPPYASWGRDLSTSMPHFETAPWLAIFPGLGISAVVFGANLLGDALRDVLDPRLKRV